MKGTGLPVIQAVVKNLQIESTSKNNGNRQHQWLLTLEKAYLALQNKMHNTSGNVDSDSTKGGTDTKVFDAPDMVVFQSNESQSISKSRSEPKVVRADIDRQVDIRYASTVNLENSKETLIRSADQHQNSCFDSKNGYVRPKFKSVSSVPPKLVNEFPQLKSAYLLKAEHGFHLVIRDVNLGDEKSTVVQIRNLFAKLEIHVSKITVNGNPVWDDKDMDRRDTGDMSIKPIKKDY